MQPSAWKAGPKGSTVHGLLHDTTRKCIMQYMGRPAVGKAYRARSTARGLAAMAVMNMAEEMVDVWKAVFMTKAPAHPAWTAAHR